MYKLTFFLLLLGSFSFAQVNTTKSTTKPNLIVIMTDDMGWADVGFNGCKDIPTPNIDSIANEGVRFEEGYVSFPVCGPSRAGFLTGRYQDRFGFTTNPSIDPNNPISGLPLEVESVNELDHIPSNSEIIPFGSSYLTFSTIKPVKPL